MLVFGYIYICQRLQRTDGKNVRVSGVRGKLEQNGLRKINNVVNSTATQFGTEATVGLGGEIGMQGAKNIFGPSNTSFTPKPIPQSAAADATRVAPR